MCRLPPGVPGCSGAPFVNRLKRQLQNDLQKVGIRADVEAEKVGTTKLYRFRATAGKFAKLSHRERQNVVWQIVDGMLDPSQRLRISMITTMTPSELGEAA